MKWFIVLLLIIGCTDNTEEEMKLIYTGLNSEKGNYTYPLWWLGTQIPVTYDANGVYYSYNVSDNVSDLLALTQYYVSTVGDNGNTGLSEVQACATIQGAIDKGAKNIKVLAGAYDGSDFVQNYYTDIAVVGVGTVTFTKSVNTYFAIIPRDAPRRIYFENITFNRNLDFVGTPTFSNLGSKGYLKGVILTTPTSIDGTTNRNGISSESIPMILQGCTSSNANRDNFNYHNAKGVANFECIEIDCISENPSNNDSNTNNQSSTAHEGTMMLRIGGNYLNGNSQVIADTNTGAQSVLIGCTMDQQKALSGGGATILSVGKGEAFKCDLLGISAPLNITSESPYDLTLRDCNSQHTTETGTIIIL